MPERRRRLGRLHDARRRRSGALDEGDHSFAVRAYGVDGSVDPTPAVVRFTIDRTAPALTFESPAEGDHFTSADFSGAAGTAVGDGAVVFALYTSAGSYYDSRQITPTDGRWAAHLKTPPPGDYRATVTQTDSAGNRTSIERDLHSDGPPPNTSIRGGTAPVVSYRTVVFTYSGADAYECRLDGSDWAACPASGQRYDGLADGAHLFEVRAISPTGVPDPTPATNAWRIDTTAPVVRIDQPEGWTTATAAAPDGSGGTATGDPATLSVSISGPNGSNDGTAARLGDGTWGYTATSDLPAHWRLHRDGQPARRRRELRLGDAPHRDRRRAAGHLDRRRPERQDRRALGVVQLQRVADRGLRMPPRLRRLELVHVTVHDC